MDQDNCSLAASLVSASYVSQGAQALAKRDKLVKTLLSQRKLPDAGWDEATILKFIQVPSAVQRRPANFRGASTVSLVCLFRTWP